MISKTLIIMLSLSLINTTLLFSQAKKEKPNLRRMSDNRQFQSAKQLYKLKKYDTALQLFTEYLEIYLNGIHRKEAYKNIANIYFDNFDYIKSIKSNSSLYGEYSNSPEGIEAFFKTGICYQKMGYIIKAKDIFKSIIENNPESNYAYKAKIKLNLIQIINEE